MSVYQQSW